MIGGLLFTFWRLMEIVTLIPTLGMLVRILSASPHRTFLLTPSVGLLRRQIPEI